MVNLLEKLKQRLKALAEVSGKHCKLPVPPGKLRSFTWGNGSGAAMLEILTSEIALGLLSLECPLFRGRKANVWCYK